MKRFFHFLSGVLTVVCGTVLTALIMLTNSMPEQFNVIQGTNLTLNNVIAVKETSSKSGDIIKASSMSAGSTYTANLKLLGIFPMKSVAVNVVDLPLVHPCGTPFGIKMFTNGVLVVGMSDVDTAEGNYNPAKAAGIKTGDVIVSIANVITSTTEDVAKVIENSGGKSLVFRIRRDNIEFNANFTPAKSITENRWKAGLWVRDSSAGIGTMTFYEMKSKRFGGLGHAVCDVDTGEIIPIASGEIVPARIYSIIKGVNGDPGELRGGFELGTLGQIKVNGETGIYGNLTLGKSAQNSASLTSTIPVSMKQQVKTGKAQVLTTIDGTEPKYYDIRIDQVRYNDSSLSRNMVITITDPELLNVTGGIVQGMSGSPIIQDGKLIGAVTHVFVNDPTQGFAIFAENMLKTVNSLPSDNLENVS